jgi:hypothetical protein
MDVSLQLSSGQTLQQSETRGLDASKGLQPSGDLSFSRFSEAFQRQDLSVKGGFSVSGVLDRVRADFEAFKLKMASSQEPTYVNAGTKASPTENLTQAMNSAMRAQINIFEIGVTFNAGLTATQQSQNGVKTLVEKA